MGSSISTPLAVSIAIPVLGGLLGSELTKESIVGWYKTINRPSWNPPAWVFGPVWSVLYATLGVAAYQVWVSDVGGLQSRALRLYAAQLGLNFLWPQVFFNMRNLTLSVLVNLSLLVTAIATQGAFYKVTPEAGKLLIPYVVWLIFANLLNIAVWRMNPHAGEVDNSKPRPDASDNQGDYGPIGPTGKPATSAALAPQRAANIATRRTSRFQPRLMPRTLHSRIALRRPAMAPRLMQASTAASAVRAMM